MKPDNRQSEIGALLFQAGVHDLSATMLRLAASTVAATGALERFTDALAISAEEWPDVVLEDILDAEYLGEE